VKRSKSGGEWIHFAAGFFLRGKSLGGLATSSPKRHVPVNRPQHPAMYSPVVGKASRKHLTRLFQKFTHSLGRRQGESDETIEG
jgi:hypothetical protein